MGILDSRYVKAALEERCKVERWASKGEEGEILIRKMNLACRLAKYAGIAASLSWFEAPEEELKDALARQSELGRDNWIGLYPGDPHAADLHEGAKELKQAFDQGGPEGLIKKVFEIGDRNGRDNSQSRGPEENGPDKSG